MLYPFWSSSKASEKAFRFSRIIWIEGYSSVEKKKQQPPGCQALTAAAVAPTEFHGSLPATHLRSYIAIDLKGMPEDNNGMKYLVVIVHGAASWVHAYPTMTKEARIVVGCVSMFIAAYGRADEVRCDAALELTGGDMVDVCAMFHMLHVPTLKESPQSHGTEAHVKRVAL